MRSVCISVVAFVLVFTARVGAEDKADPRESLPTAISEAIRLLEAKEYVAFMKAFVAPDDLKKLPPNASLETVAEQFGKGKAARLLDVLKSIRDTAPTLDESGTKATYTVNERPLHWVKVDKYWYIKN